MKPYIKYIFILLSAAGLAGSCTVKEQAPAPGFYSDSQSVRINPVINTAYIKSRSVLGTNEEQTVFNDGSRISVSNGNIFITYSKGPDGWTPEGGGYLRWGNDPDTYYAYYPAGASRISTESFSVPLSQNTLENLASADYMSCTVTDVVKPSDGVLQLEMERKMAKVEVTVSGLDEGKRVQNFTISSYAGYESGEVSSSVVEINPYAEISQGGIKGGNGCVFTAVVTPGANTPSAIFMSMISEGKGLRINGIPAMTAGKCYSYNLDLSGSLPTLSLAGIADWNDGVVEEGFLSKSELESWFVTVNGAGTRDGLSWNNAFSAEDLQKKLDTGTSNKDEMNGIKIHLAEGNYYITGSGDKGRIKLEYTGYRIQMPVTIYGGYPEGLTGTETGRRAPAEYETVFDGNGENNDKTAVGLFQLGNQIDVTFDGCVFQDSNVGDAGAFNVTPGATGDATLRLNDCVIRNCTTASDAGAAIRVRNKSRVILTDTEIYNCNSKEWGGAIKINAAEHIFEMTGGSVHDCSVTHAYGSAFRFENLKTATLENVEIYNNSSSAETGALRVEAGKLYMSGCEIHDNKAANRGAGIRTLDVTVFMKDCLFYNNDAPEAWGTALHAGASAIFTNNCTFIGKDGTAGTSVTVNGDANFILANTTVTSSNGRAFRAGGSGNSIIVNSMFMNGGENVIAYESATLKSKGYNVYQGTPDITMDGTDTDYTGITVSDTDGSDWYFQWSIPAENPLAGYATGTYVIDAVRTHGNIIGSGLGDEFVDWVGKENFGKDVFGTDRGSSMWPGAYQGI